MITVSREIIQHSVVNKSEALSGVDRDSPIAEQYANYENPQSKRLKRNDKFEAMTTEELEQNSDSSGDEQGTSSNDITPNRTKISTTSSSHNRISNNNNTNNNNNVNSPNKDDNRVRQNSNIQSLKSRFEQKNTTTNSNNNNNT